MGVLSLGSPLATPFWAEANIVGGFVVVACVSLTSFSPAVIAYVVLTGLILPILYYTNTWYSQYMPYVPTISDTCCAEEVFDSMLSRVSHDNTGSSYNVSRVVNPDASFNLTAYQQYSPVFLSCVV